MKILRTLFILIFLTVFIHAFSQEWVRTFTSTTGNGYIGWDLIEPYDHGYIILADTYDYKYCLIIKTDINGFEIWKKLVGNNNYKNVPENIEQTMDSGYIISGSTTKYGNEDAYIMKLNPCFEKEWCKVLHTENYYGAYGRNVKQLPNGGYLLLTAYYGGTSPGQRIHLHKFDASGELIWQYVYAFSDSLLFGEEGFDLNIINENEYLITGYGFYPDSGQTNSGWKRPLLIIADSSGNAYWETIWGANDYFYGRPWYNSIVDHSGSIYDLGYRVGDNARYPVIFKTKSDGQEDYYSEIIDSCYDGAAAAPTWMEDSLIFATIGWWNWDGSLFWGFFKLDTLGNIIDYKDITDPLVSIVSIVKTFDNKYISVGINSNENNKWVIYAYKLNSNMEYDTLYTTPFVYDSLCPYEITSDTTDLDCDILVLVDDQFVPLNEVELKIFPNPAHARVKISYPDVTHSGQREITILNSLGIEVKYVRLMMGDEETELDVSGLPAGIYFVEMMERGRRITSGKMVVSR
jgi:hypothetical protein